MAPRIQDNDGDYMFDHKQQLQTIHESCIPPTSIQQSSSSAICTSNTTRTQKRCVSFGAMTTTHTIMGLSDYTAQELEASWYDSNNMQTMKETARSDAKLVDAGLLTEGRDVSIRGLEHRTMKGLKRKQRSRLNAYLSIFFEIEAQIEEDYNTYYSSNNNMNDDIDNDIYYYHCFDDEAIADAYFEHSEPCAVDAHMMGMQDERNARKIYDEHEPMNYQSITTDNYEHSCGPLLQFQPAFVTINATHTAIETYTL